MPAERGVEHDVDLVEQLVEGPSHGDPCFGEHLNRARHGGVEVIRHPPLDQGSDRQGGSNVGDPDQFHVLLQCDPVGETLADHAKPGNANLHLAHVLSSLVLWFFAVLMD